MERRCIGRLPSAMNKLKDGTMDKVTRMDQMEWMDVLGPRIQFITPETGVDSDYCIMNAVIGAGVFIPLHSHEDRETFYILSGSAEGYLDGQWHRVVPGGVLDIKGGEKHAWRNNSSEETRLLFVTTMRMKHFFDEIARPVPDVPAPPSPEVLSRMFEVAHRYGYWLATPQENLQIGLAM
jgi:quercetin dioxygenase-like cupin family protein